MSGRVKLYLRHLEGGGGGKKINPGLFPLCLSFAHSFTHSCPFSMICLAGGFGRA